MTNRTLAGRKIGVPLQDRIARIIREALRLSTIAVAGLGATGSFAAETVCNADLAPITGLFSVNRLVLPNADEPQVFETCLAIASHATLGARDTERYVFDGATHQLNFSGARLYSNGWSLGANLSVMSFSGGYLDAIIDQWHDTFGLPNGVRDQLPEDELALLVQRDGNTLAQLSRTTTHAGDLEIVLAQPARRLGRGNWQLAYIVKLPTGREAEFSGTGALSLGAAGVGDLPLGNSGRWSMNWQVVAQWHANDTWQNLSTRQWQLSATVNTALQLRPGWSLRAGLTSATTIVESDLRPFAKPPLSLDIGTSIDWGPARWYFGFSEDLRVNSQPDVVFHAGVRFF